MLDRLRALIEGRRESAPGDGPELSLQELERLHSLGYVP